MFYLVKWDHIRIIVLSKRTTGWARVRLTAPNATGTTNVEVNTYASFSQLSPSVVRVVAPVDVPTTGGSVLQIDVHNIQGAELLRATVGPYNCTITATAAIGSPELTTATLPGWMADPANSYLDSTGQQTWKLFCLLGPGQGGNLTVRVSRIIGSAVDPSDGSSTLSYNAPRVDEVIVDELTSVSGMWPQSIVTVATNGSTLRVVGRDMGVSPTIQLGDGYVLSFAAGDMRPCPGQNTPLLFPHACFMVTSPPGEGTGLGLLPYTATTGFTWTLMQGNQPSVPLLYRHAAPQVTGVTSATGTFPTQGGPLLTISGRNFGVTKPGRAVDVSIFFRRAGDRDPPRPCLDDDAVNPATRIDHWTLTCHLPEGSGSGMELLVIIAGIASANNSVTFSYDPPVIFNASVYPVDPLTLEPILDPTAPLPTYNGSNSSYDLYNRALQLPGGSIGARTQLRGGTRGNDTVVVLTGANLGALNPLAHCVCMADLRRRAAFPAGVNECTCDELETFLGEGEVPPYRILSWSHTSIMFRPNPGVGLKEILLSVRGNGLGLPRFSPQAINYAYEPPRITAIAPSTGRTDGGFKVTLQGNNFGPAPRNFSNPDARFPSPYFARDGFLVPLEDAPGLPTAFFEIRFHRAIVPSGLDYSGEPIPELDAATGSAADWGHKVLSWDHDKIEFQAPGGIGAHRTVTVSVLFGTPGVNMQSWTSTPVEFSYLPPHVTRADPSIVFLTDKPALTVHVLGENYGDDAIADRDGWTPDERRVSVGFNYSTLCLTTERVRINGVVELRCLVNPNTTVGFNEIHVVAAGQEGVSPAWPQSGALHAVCAAGYFAKANRNESCLACPAMGAVCPGYLQYVEDYDARHTYPVPLPGFYNLNDTQASACPGPQFPGRPGSLPGRDVCIVPCEPAESCLGDNWCAVGYRSKAPNYRCADCDLHYYKRAGQCIKCPDSPAMLVIGFILLVAAAAGLGVILQRKQVNIAVVSIGVDYFQVLAIFSQSKIKWPESIKELFHVLSAFNLNIEIVAPECLMPDVSYIQKFAVVLLVSAEQTSP